VSHPSRKRGFVNSTLAAAALSMGLGAAGCAHALPQGMLALPEGARAAFAQCGVDAEHVDAIWKEYREQRPFHAQQIAASEPFEGGCRVLILSEPPTDVTTARLGEIHPAFNAFIPERHAIGVDGWTEDLVGVIPPMPDEELSDLTSDLHVTLFGSAYRARLAPIKAPTRWNGTLDIEVRPDEVYGWVFGEDASFWSVDGGPRQRAADLLDPRQTGVYTSSAPGLVLWSLPKTGSFEEQKANVRIFGLESDLLLGAVADEDTVLVIGRERIAPEEVLPPLRFETVKILATTSLGELQQSYERNQLMAGPLRSGKDWAPILLSPELVDTEFGSVLNITDQMLKRWSMNGTVDYERFKYRNEPTQWAFTTPIAQELEASSLTFNWNTAASGGLVKVSDDRSLYWMTRTGALHVSYLPGDTPDARTAGYEDRARDFFARQSDPYLVRAVQYTALFQAFRQLGVSAIDEKAEAEAMVGQSAAIDLLASAGTAAFTRLVKATDGELKEASRLSVERAFASVDASVFLEHAIESEDLENRAGLRRAIRNASANKLQSIMTSVKEGSAADTAKKAIALRWKLEATNDVAAPRHLAVALAHQGLVHFALKSPDRWHAFTAALSSKGAIATAAEIDAAAVFLAKHGFEWRSLDDWRATAEILGNVDWVEERYRAVSGARVTTGRIRTPTVVRSHNGTPVARGGHNVGSEVPSLTRPIEVSQLPHLHLDKEGLSYRPSPQPLRYRPAALGGIASRPPLLEIAEEGVRVPAPAAAGGGWARLPEEPKFDLGGDVVSLKLFDAGAKGAAPGSPLLRSRFKVAVDDSVYRAGSSSDVAESAVRSLKRASRQKGEPLRKIDIRLSDAHITPDEALGVARSIHSRIVRYRLDATDSYVLVHGDSPIDLGDFDLARARVSAPIRTGNEFTISVSVPVKQGRAHGLFLKFMGRGEPGVDAVAKAQEALGATLRTPEDIAHELKSRFGKPEDASLLEMAIDAQGGFVDNTISVPVPRSRHGGTLGHSF
jgi:hypothetical protein